MEDFVFGNASYILNIIYLLNLGKTSSLTVKEDVSLPQNCWFNCFDCQKYVEIRNVACARLTLLNGSYGGEVMFPSFFKFN